MNMIKGIFLSSTAALLMACPATDDGNDDIGVGSDSSGQVTTISGGGSDDDTAGGDDGVDDGVGTTTGATTAAGSESGMAGECDNGGRCMAAAPDGWMGPIAIYRGLADGSDVPACEAGGFESKGLTMLSGYSDPGPAVCGCECGVNVEAYCYMYGYDYGAACNGFVGQIYPTLDCDAYPITGGAYFYMYASGVANCQADKTTTLPEVQWDAMVSSCSGADTSQECADGGFCTPKAPAGYESGLCVFAQGDMECPADTYTDKQVVYNGADDTRGCGVCWCGTGTATCSGNLEVFTSDDCSGTAIASVPGTGNCDASAAGGQSAFVDFTGTNECPVETPPEPVGEIKAGTAFTYCCEPAGG